MSYYQALGLTREPFSNSPDPDMLYRSRTHLECLQHMEIAVRLRRGLNVVLGEVGTGKTTLSRELARLLPRDGDIEAHILGNPYCPSPTDFLLSLARLFGLDAAAMGREPALIIDALKAELVSRGQDGGRTVALLIDEGQKITPECLELLRELLNVETNVHKLLQIIIFAQTEFEEILYARPNLEDRVNFLYRLTPLDREQTRRMIETRLLLCTPDGKIPAVFTRLALRRIHKLTGGYPRKIVRLCHLSMLLAVGFGKRRIGWKLVGRASRDSRVNGRVWLRRLVVAGAAGALAVSALTFVVPALPDVRQAALDALGRVQTSLAAVAFAPAAPKVEVAAAVDAPPAVALPVAPVRAVAELPACEEALGLVTEATLVPAVKTAGPAAKTGQPASRAIPAAAPKAEAALPNAAAAAVKTLDADSQITKATAAAATQVPVQVAAAPVVQAAAPAAPAAAPAAASLAPVPAPQGTVAGFQTTAASAPAVQTPAAPPQAPVAALPAAAKVETPTFGRAHGGNRTEPATLPVPAAQTAVAGTVPQTPQVPAAAPAVPAGVAQAPVAPAAVAPAVAPRANAPATAAPAGPARPSGVPAGAIQVSAPAGAATVLATPVPVQPAPRLLAAPAAPAQGLGAALTLAAAALPPEAAEQIIVVAPEYAGAQQAAPVPAAPAAPAVRASAMAMPEILGESSVRAGWAVSRQAARVYGHARRAIMTRIAKVNPGMDFNRVHAGDPILFPAIPAEPLPQGACLVRVGRVESLEKGFAVIGRQRETDPALSLYCSLQPDLGLRFDLVLPSLFPNRQEAETALASLPRELAAHATVVDGYPAGTVAFTDVSLWPGRGGTPNIAAPAPAAARQVAASGLAGQDILP